MGCNDDEQCCTVPYICTYVCLIREIVRSRGVWLQLLVAQAETGHALSPDLLIPPPPEAGRARCSPAWGVGRVPVG